MRRFLFVVQQTNQIVEELLAMALHQVIERRVVAGGEPGHVRSVARVKLVGSVAHGLTFTEKLTLPMPRGPS